VRSGDWIVGLPFDLEIKTRRGTMMLRLVRMATKVDPMWLAEIAPQLAKVEGGLNPTFDLKQDAVVSTQQTFFNGSKIREEVVPTSDHPEAANVFCLWLANQMAI